MSKLLDQFNAEYDFLYNAQSHVSGFREAVAWFDDNQGKPGISEHVQALMAERNDFISSDREAAAFAFACEKLDIGV